MRNSRPEKGEVDGVRVWSVVQDGKRYRFVPDED
jgi:hypothetical protein